MSGKQRHLRKKRALNEDEEEEAAAAAAAGPTAAAAAAGHHAPEVQRELLHDLKLLQRQRKRVPGVDASKLTAATGGAGGELDGGGAEDNELMDAQYVKAEETNKSQILDEKEHMDKFVEQELARRLGKSVDERATQLSKAEQQERELYQVPEGFETSLTKEVSLPGMMTAITEVEVSKEAKMAKIEATEKIKAAALTKKSGRADEGDGSGAGLRRSMFAYSFGKDQRKVVDVDKEAVHAARRFITDRSVDPVEAAKARARKQAHKH